MFKINIMDKIPRENSFYNRIEETGFWIQGVFYTGLWFSCELICFFKNLAKYKNIFTLEVTHFYFIQVLYYANEYFKWIFRIFRPFKNMLLTAKCLLLIWFTIEGLNLYKLALAHHTFFLQKRNHFYNKTFSHTQRLQTQTPAYDMERKGRTPLNKVIMASDLLKRIKSQTCHRLSGIRKMYRLPNLRCSYIFVIYLSVPY